jgi:hypothetical protein
MNGGVRERGPGPRNLWGFSKDSAPPEFEDEDEEL